MTAIRKGLNTALLLLLFGGAIILGTLDGARDANAQAFSGSCAALRGSFTGTLTGYASPPTGTIQYRVTTSCTVTLWTTAAITGTSNAATMTMTGLPYNLQPASSMVAAQLLPGIVQDNGANAAGCVSIPAASGTLTFSNSGACAGAMTATAAKGLPAGWEVTYTLY
jgi:hypothetical protein